MRMILSFDIVFDRIVIVQRWPRHGPPDRFGLCLNPRDGIYDQNRSVEDGYCPIHFDTEIDVSWIVN